MSFKVSRLFTQLEHGCFAAYAHAEAEFADNLR
jgi:hypothetical protein